ncbi:MAG: hypothetical protein AB9888_13110 [Bacteroidales bacterium]
MNPIKPKKKLGRPPLSQETVVVQIKLRLKVGQDDDLIKFFDNIPKGQIPACLKSALRSGNIDIFPEELVEEYEIMNMIDNMVF